VILQVPAPAIDLCTRWEGLHKVVVRSPEVMVVPYLCPALVPTIGFGSTRYADGRRVQLGDPPITEREAKLLLLYRLEADYRDTIRLCPNLAAASPERAGAILSFVYNLGIGRLRTSTLRRRVLQEDWSEAAYEIQRWVWAGGKKLAGLVARRADEARLLQ